MQWTMNKLIAVLLFAALLPLAGCDRGSRDGAANPKAMPEAGVFVIGGIHQTHDDAKIYTYQRMGELFAALRPDVLCVEVLQRYVDDGSLKGMPRDFRKAMVPMAQEKEIPIVGIDWWDEARGEEWQKLQREAYADPAIDAEVQLHGEIFSALNDYFEQRDFREINSAEISDLWAAKNALKHAVVSKHKRYAAIAAFERERNEQMVSKVLAVVRDNPGKSVLVAVGIDHKYFIEGALRSNGVSVLQARDLQL